MPEAVAGQETRPSQNAVALPKQTTREDAVHQETPPDPILLDWLAGAGAPPAMAGRITARLGSTAVEQLRENPWLVLEVPGTGPAAADAVALSVLGPEPQYDDPRRTRALVGWLLRRAAHLGSTAHGADLVADELKQFSVGDPAGAIADAIETGQVHAFAEPVALDDSSDDEESDEFEELDNTDDDDPAALLTSPRTMLCLERWAFIEQAAAEVVQRLFATPDPLEPAPGAEGTTNANANADQQLVAAVAEGGLTLATGVDASGLLPLLEAFPHALVTAPSAASLRTLHAAGVPAIDSRALAAEDYAAYAALAATTEDTPLLVVADAQLLSLEAGTALLEASAEGTHVLLSGDAVSLGSSEPGMLFRDLLEIEEPEFGGRLPRVAIKRRPTGPLSALVEAVRYGGLPPIELLQGPDGKSKDVVIVAVKDPQEAIGRTLQLVADSIPRTFQLTGPQVQVVTARADGPVGAVALNAALKERLNPGPGRCAGFDPGDRVVVPGPVPETGLYGGETGTVTVADESGLTVRLDLPREIRHVRTVGIEAQNPAASADKGEESGTGAAVADGAADEAAQAEAGAEPGMGAAAEIGSTPRAELVIETETEPEWRIDGASAARGLLRHGWALTAREAQGGRWPAVVAVFDGGAAAAGLSRALVLGMVNLATEHLSVVHGAGPLLATAVETVPDQPRRTRLRHALRD